MLEWKAKKAYFYICSEKQVIKKIDSPMGKCKRCHAIYYLIFKIPVHIVDSDEKRKPYSVHNPIYSDLDNIVNEYCMSNKQMEVHMSLFFLGQKSTGLKPLSIYIIGPHSCGILRRK